MFPTGPIAISVDDTKAHKVGKKIASASYQRDPLSPPFHPNLIWAQRFIHFSLIFPLHRNGEVPARSLPVRFQDAPVLKKPGIRGSEQQWEAYRQQVKQTNLSAQARTTAEEIRKHLDQLGQANRSLLLPVDGSFCNRRFFREPLDRTYILARARKDARLCLPAPAGSRRRYDATLFTPEGVRQDEKILWKTTKLFYGGKRRKVRYKEIAGVLWQSGAKTRSLRLFVIAPTPYRKRKSAKLYYRQPAFLLCTDLTSSARQLLQIYLDRWQIEVNHREEKDTLGIGQAQLWNPTSVPRQPVLAVAAYSALMLASLTVFGAARGKAYAELPRWRRNARRPSCLDLVTLLRKEATQSPDIIAGLGIHHSPSQLVAAAAA